MTRHRIIALLLIIASGCATQGPNAAVKDLWARTSPSAAANAAFYMVVENDGNEPDRLIRADSPACQVTELHEMYAKDGGVMGMRPVEGGFVEIPAGESVEFKPGGLHVMCIDRLQDFVAGTTVPLTLTFEISGTRSYEVTIREN